MSRAERRRVARKYVVSQDKESGLWYAHMAGFPYIPIMGSFSEKKIESMEYAKMYNCLPNKVEKIEEERRKNKQLLE